MSEVPSDEVPYKDFGLTEEEYWECRQNMHTPSFYSAFYVPCTNSCNVLYFDSDDGIALFSSCVDMFEGTGFQMKLIDCNYCDIPFSYMIDIIEIFKEFEEEIDKQIDEEVDE